MSLMDSPRRGSALVPITVPFTHMGRPEGSLGLEAKSSAPTYVSLAQTGKGLHGLLHQVFPKAKLIGSTRHWWKQVTNTSLCRDMCLTQTVEIVLLFVSNREGSRAEDTVFEAQDSGHSPRLWGGNPQSGEERYTKTITLLNLGRINIYNFIYRFSEKLKKERAMDSASSHAVVTRNWGALTHTLLIPSFGRTRRPTARVSGNRHSLLKPLDLGTWYASVPTCGIHIGTSTRRKSIGIHHNFLGTVKEG